MIGATVLPLRLTPVSIAHHSYLRLGFQRAENPQPSLIFDFLFLALVGECPPGTPSPGNCSDSWQPELFSPKLQLYLCLSRPLVLILTINYQLIIFDDHTMRTTGVALFVLAASAAGPAFSAPLA